MKIHYEEAAEWAKKKERLITEINQSGIPLVLFGWASAVDPAFLNRLTVPVEYLCDNDAAKWGRRLWGLEVTGPEGLPFQYSSYNVLILVPFEHQIIPQLEKLPLPPQRIWHFDFYFEEAGTEEYFKAHEPELLHIYESLMDDLSKQTFEAVVNYRIGRFAAYLKRISRPREDQYFPKILGGKPFLSAEETFVDGGAFIGDTIERFCKETGYHYREIYAFEPDKNNFTKLEENTKGLAHVHCFQTGIGGCAGRASFVSDTSGSRIEATGEQAIEIDSLDRLLTGVQPTFIKMDVEGAECDALRGAGKLIQSLRPKLAICTYHANADMIQVPLLIQSLNPSYQLYFRHYTNSLVETVCYAI